MWKVSESQPGFMLPGPCNNRFLLFVFFFFSHQNKCQKVLWLFNKGESHSFSNERNGYGQGSGVAGSSVEPSSPRNKAHKDTFSSRVCASTCSCSKQGSNPPWGLGCPPCWPLNREGKSLRQQSSLCKTKTSTNAGLGRKILAFTSTGLEQFA